jgi:hypothetical protein
MDDTRTATIGDNNALLIVRPRDRAALVEETRRNLRGG